MGPAGWDPCRSGICSLNEEGTGYGAGIAHLLMRTVSMLTSAISTIRAERLLFLKIKGRLAAMTTNQL
jgi:hypothetical protein